MRWLRDGMGSILWWVWNGDAAIKITGFEEWNGDSALSNDRAVLHGEGRKPFIQLSVLLRSVDAVESRVLQAKWWMWICFKAQSHEGCRHTQ